MTAIMPLEDFRQGLTTVLIVALCFALMRPSSSAQIGRVPTPVRARSVPYSYPSPSAKQTLATTANVIDFGTVPEGAVAFKAQAVSVTAANPIVNIDINDSSTDPSTAFISERNTDDQPCSDKLPAANVRPGDCTIVVGFMPVDNHSRVTATMTIVFLNQEQESFTLNGQGSSTGPCKSPNHVFLPLNRGFTQGDLYPLLPIGVPVAPAKQIYKDFGDPVRKSLVNCYYATDSLFSYFNQFQSIYNAASGATTLNAQVGSLNFTNGMQVTVGTNPQIGAPSSNSTSASSSSSPPTLSAGSAAQAAQNVVNGGTIFGLDLFPLFSKQSLYTFTTLSTAVKEGVDLQKFNNTSITSNNPSTHTFIGLEGYFQLTSSNNAPSSAGPAGSIFLGWSYGYDLMNHSYSIQNGFGGRVNTQIAQVSAGILLNGVVKIAAYRGFGPSQRYIDSTSMSPKTVNNFQTWSIAIAYQKSGSQSTK